MKKAVILLSGGIDSSTTLAIAKSEGYESYALSFDYNQRHKIELESAKNIALSARVKKHLVIKFDLREIGGSSLTSEMKMPKSSSKFLASGESSRRQVLSSKLNNKKDYELGAMNSEPIPLTYVPARNTIFLSFALAWAEVLKAEDIFIGVNAVDYSGYPDCRPEYLKAFADMANLATKASVEGKMKFRINAPLINMTKAGIIKKGTDLGIDYSLTWSCYDPQPVTPYLPSEGGVIPCGRCDSCLFRAKGFKEAGIKDPLLSK